MRLLLSYLFLALAFFALAAKTYVVAKPDERLVVFRFGKLLGVRGPGLNIVVPFLDRAVRIKVEKIAGWSELSEDELRARAAQAAQARDA